MKQMLVRYVRISLTQRPALGNPFLYAATLHFAVTRFMCRQIKFLRSSRLFRTAEVFGVPTASTHAREHTRAFPLRVRARVSTLVSVYTYVCVRYISRFFSYYLDKNLAQNRFTLAKLVRISYTRFLTHRGTDTGVFKANEYD